MDLLVFPNLLLQRIDWAWTFFLLMARFTGLFIFLPGLGSGAAGLVVRFPAIMVLSMASIIASTKVPVPANSILVATMLISELMFGALLGLLPMLIITGIQTAMGFASTTMGLQASQLIDPTIQASVPDLSRIFGDLTILVFLSLGGHYFIIYAASGMGGLIVPGSFFVSGQVIEVLVRHSSQVFEIAVLFSAPVLVALLITNVVLGLISRAVPSVNVFIISFPLTIAVGLVLSYFLFAELVPFVSPWVSKLDIDIRGIAEAIGHP